MATVKITLSITATAGGMDEICEATNLVVGGGTYQSFTHALSAAGVLTISAIFTLSCPDRRLASHNIRSLQTDFGLLSEGSFTDAANAETFSDSVSVSSSDLASEFEDQLSVTLGVTATASVSDVELTVPSSASGAEQHQGIHVLVWTPTLAAVAFLHRN